MSTSPAARARVATCAARRPAGPRAARPGLASEFPKIRTPSRCVSRLGRATCPSARLPPPPPPPRPLAPARPRAPRPRQRQAQPPEQDGASPQRHVRALRLPTRRAVSLRRDLRERVLPQARTRHRAGRRRHRRRRQHRPVRDVRRAEVSSGARVHARTPAPHVHQPPSQRSRKPRRRESRPGSTRGPGRRVTTRRYPRGVYILVR